MSTSQTWPRRAVHSEHRRRQLRLLVTDLQPLQAKYPELSDDIQADIDEHLGEAERTRESDRADVLRALGEWTHDALSVENLIDDTGLSKRVVRGALAELLSETPPLIGVRQEIRGPGRPTKFYFLL